MGYLSALRQRWPDGRFVRDTLLLGSGMAVSQVVMLAAMPIWSRLYTPADFGVLGVWMAVAGIVSILLSLRYDTCIVLAQNDDEARALAQLCAALAAGLGLLLCAATWLLPMAARHTLGVAALGAWLPGAVIAGALSAVLSAGLYVMNRQQRYARMAWARIALGVVAAVTGVGLGLAGVSSGLLITQWVASVAALLVLMVGAGGAYRACKPWVGRDALTHAARQHKNAPRYLWPSALLDVATQQLPFLLVAGWFSKELAGQFSLTWRVVAMPLFMLSGAAGTVFFQRMSRLAEQPVEARQLLLGTWRLFAWIGMLPAVALIGWGEPLFVLAFGPQWAGAGRIASILMPMLWVMFVSSPTSSSLIVHGLQKWSLLFGVAMVLYRPAALWIGMRLGRLELGLWIWVGMEILTIALFNLLILRKLRH